MADSMDIGAEARQLLTAAYDGVLSTLSVEVSGYPFGSVLPYALDRSGRPVILIADIAQHTKNIRADCRVSLIVLDRGADDVQSSGRLTLLADALPVADEESDAIERYYRYFPDSRDYHKTHGFDFFRLNPVRLRYIGGFGRIHWLHPDRVIRANPFGADQEAAMVRHMNADHVEALRRYLAAQEMRVAAGSDPEMAGIDGEGFHVRVGARIVRFSFPTPVTTPAEVRAALVAMARGSSDSHPAGA